MPDDPKSLSVATNKERFDLVYNRLKSIHDISIDVVFKATAAFLLVTGWAVTSDKAMTRLGTDAISRWMAIGGLVVYALLFAIAAHRTARSSIKASTLLAELAYLPYEAFADLVVSKSTAYCFAGANAALCTAVCTFILRGTS